MFKKKKNKALPQDIQYLLDRIEFAIEKGKEQVYVPIETDQQEDWLYTYCESKGYIARPDHKTDGVLVYKIYGFTRDQ